MYSAENVLFRNGDIVLDEVDIDTVLLVEISVVCFDESAPVIFEGVETDDLKVGEFGLFYFDHNPGSLFASVHPLPLAEDAIQRLQTQIPSPALALNLFHELYALNIMLKKSNVVLLTKFRKKSFAIMPERCMADIMTQRNGFY